MRPSHRWYDYGGNRRENGEEKRMGTVIGNEKTYSADCLRVEHCGPCLGQGLARE